MPDIIKVPRKDVGLILMGCDGIWERYVDNSQGLIDVVKDYMKSTKDGKVILVTGSPGGRTIINTVFCIVLNVIEFGMDGRQAVDAPRMHHQWLPDTITLEKDSISETDLDILKKMGHDIRQQGTQGDGNSIIVDPKRKIAFGINDRRNPTSKASK